MFFINVLNIGKSLGVEKQKFYQRNDYMGLWREKYCFLYVFCLIDNCWFQLYRN